jgi:hypothetical protein
MRGVIVTVPVILLVTVPVIPPGIFEAIKLKRS